MPPVQLGPQLEYCWLDAVPFTAICKECVADADWVVTSTAAPLNAHCTGVPFSKSSYHSSASQSGVQPSPDTALPSSHGSSGASTALPQRLTVQLKSQPSPSTWLPSSHSSLPLLAPLPQPESLQVVSQPSPSMVLPSSH